MSDRQLIGLDGPMPRVRMSDELRQALSAVAVPDVTELDEPADQFRGLEVLRRCVAGLDGLLAQASELVTGAGGVVIENCVVEPDAIVALLSAAFGPVDPLGNGIPSRLVFDVTPRRTESGLSTAGSSRGTGLFWLHSDSANFPVPHTFVTLACVTVEPGHGGDSLLLNAESIAADLARRGRTHSLRLLADPVFPFMSGHRYDHEVVPGPILYQEDGTWCVRYRRQLIEQGREHQQLDEQHVRAVADFDETITEPELLEEFTLQRNDMWVLDNRRWLHGRRAFTADANRLLKRCKMYGAAT